MVQWSVHSTPYRFVSTFLTRPARGGNRWEGGARWQQQSPALLDFMGIFMDIYRYLLHIYEDIYWIFTYIYWIFMRIFTFYNLLNNLNNHREFYWDIRRTLMNHDDYDNCFAMFCRIHPYIVGRLFFILTKYIVGSSYCRSKEPTRRSKIGCRIGWALHSNSCCALQEPHQMDLDFFWED